MDTTYIDPWDDEDPQVIANMIEGEMMVEFGSSWVAGGGSASDVAAAWRDHCDDYTAGRIG